MSEVKKDLHPRMRWWGWGEPDEPHELTDRSLELLRERLGINPADRSEHITLSESVAPKSHLSDDVRQSLIQVVGPEGFSETFEDRVERNAGKSYPDLVRQRKGEFTDAPDAVVSPRDTQQVEKVLEICEIEKIAVVPFGGGTSVVGGVSPIREQFDALVSLDLGRMSGVHNIDDVSHTADFLPGTRGPEAEAQLVAAGYTLGHFPQSYEFASIGGYVATRSAGQASTGYGRIDELVRGLEIVTPRGTLDLPALPATAAGPDIRELVVGSEGVFGVITKATLEIKPLPESTRYEGWMFSDFMNGAESLRKLEQGGLAPTVARLSDEQETAISLASADKGRFKDKVAGQFIRFAGHPEGCLAILGWEGDEEEIVFKRNRAAKVLREMGAKPLGTAAGDAWKKARYGGPYLRDELLDRGVFVETLETATEWSNLETLYKGVGNSLTKSLSERGTTPIVFCHISHLYPSGASLYFTFLAKQQIGEEIEQWRAAKTSACDAIKSCGGTITHHHAVGSDHAPWMTQEIGEVGVEALRGVKERLDPVGIMNPGQLLTPTHERSLA